MPCLDQFDRSPSLRRRHPEIVVQFAVDIHQRTRRGHTGLGGKREPHGVPRRGIRVLAHNEHAHLVERVGERAQDIVAARQIGVLGAQEVAHGVDLVLYPCQRLLPGFVHR